MIDESIYRDISQKVLIFERISVKSSCALQFCQVPWIEFLIKDVKSVRQVRYPDVLERQGLSLNLLSKLVMSLILEKHFVLLIFRRH